MHSVMRILKVGFIVGFIGISIGFLVSLILPEGQKDPLLGSLNHPPGSYLLGLVMAVVYAGPAAFLLGIVIGAYREWQRKQKAEAAQGTDQTR